MSFEKLVVIDGRGHLMGRLASTIAKQLLSGQRIVVVRTELIEISGASWRNEIKYSQFIKKRTATNPKRGPIHFHSPSKMFWRVVRGMLPHKTQRGKQALLRLKSFEGIPHPYDRMKRLVVPDALRALRIRPGRKCTVMKDLAIKFGWKHKEILETLEEKRKVKSKAFYEKKQGIIKKKAEAEKTAPVQAINDKLAQYGY